MVVEDHVALLVEPSDRCREIAGGVCSDLKCLAVEELHWAHTLVETVRFVRRDHQIVALLLCLLLLRLLVLEVNLVLELEEGHDIDDLILVQATTTLHARRDSRSSRLHLLM